MPSCGGLLLYIEFALPLCVCYMISMIKNLLHIDFFIQTEASVDLWTQICKLKVFCNISFYFISHKLYDFLKKYMKET